MKLLAEYDCQEAEDFEWDWETFEDDFTFHFDKVFPKREIGMIAEGHGWMKRSGHRPVCTLTAASALRKAIPASGDVSIRVYKAKDSDKGVHLAINTCHHDVPMWGQEWTYIVRPKYMEGVG
jgi:hypothetical protein